MSRAPAAVVFDLDGVIVSTEEVWDRVREDLARERGCRLAPTIASTMLDFTSSA